MTGHICSYIQVLNAACVPEICNFLVLYGSTIQPYSIEMLIKTFLAFATGESNNFVSGFKSSLWLRNVDLTESEAG